jgi:glycerate 2-kinase
VSEALREAARRIFAEALRAVDVSAAVRAHVAVTDAVLTLGGRNVPLHDLDCVLLVAIGKAAVPMYRAASEELGAVPHHAVVVAPESTLPAVEDRDSTTIYLPGAHPTPTQDSFRAADAILEMLAGTTDRTAVLFLISGGASAMVERPLSAAITLDDLAAFSRALVGSGMGITEMNTLRKHFSAVKGGRLAVAAARARMQCTLLISDVPEASPDAIASGPSLPDGTTVADTLRLFRKLKQGASIPDSFTAWFEDLALPETPKPDEAAFARAHWQVILSSDHLAQAAAQAAKDAGFHAVIDNTPDDWEYREAARYLLDRAAVAGPGTCLISVGEVNVTIPTGHGEGGRNQQFALWCAAELVRRNARATVLSAGSDGIDGHSLAAGAVCDETTVARAVAVAMNAEVALQAFDSAPLLREVNDAIVTGPTGNNLRDLRLILTGADTESGRYDK